MTDGIGTPQDFISFDRSRFSPIVLSLTVSAAGAVAFSALVGALLLYARPATAPSGDGAPRVAPAANLVAKASSVYGALVVAPAANVATKAPSVYGALVVAPAANVATNSPSVYGALAAAPAATVATNSPSVYGELVVVPAASSAATTEAENVPATPTPAVAKLVQSVPVPPLRPRGGGLLVGHVPLRASGRLLAHQESATVASTASADHRTFFQKLFGMRQASGQVLAYAAPEDGSVADGRRSPSGALLPYGRETAVYDIAAHTVYMPDGTRLEAHSGLGNRLDDPRHVNEKMRGATPPNVYELQPRAQLFHGVRALRLIPVGSGALFGRTGLLAHTYMLGQKGASFGCVSFKNYQAFLQAYEKGEVKRLVVVASLD